MAALSVASFGGCAGGAGSKPAANRLTASPSTPTAKLFDGRGKVTKINLDLVSVELEHEEIKGLMPGMIMEFYVREKKELEPLKVGDTVEFILEDDRGQEKILAIRKLP